MACNFAHTISLIWCIIDFVHYFIMAYIIKVLIESNQHYRIRSECLDVLGHGDLIFSLSVSKKKSSYFDS